MTPIPPDPGLAHWPAWLLFVLSFGLVFAVKEFRQDPKIRNILLLSLVFHHLAAILNSSGMDIPGESLDAITPLHSIGAYWALSGDFNFPYPEIKFYGVLMGLPYRLFGPSLFLGSQMTIMVFLGACFVFIKLLNLLEIRNGRHLVIFLFMRIRLPQLDKYGKMSLMSGKNGFN